MAIFTLDLKLRIIRGGGGIDENGFASYAQAVYKMQTQLEQSGKDFFYIINPIKAEIYPENLPWYERIVGKKYANKDLDHTDLLLKYFDKYGVHYYNTTKDLKKMKQNGDFEIFAKTGHHWTLKAASEEVNSIFSNMQNVTSGIDYPTIDIQRTEDRLFPTDRDILDLQNVFWGNLSKEYITPVNRYKNKSNQSVYLFGTSFGWQIADALYQSEGNRAFAKLIYQEYFINLSEYDENGQRTRAYTPENLPSDLDVMDNVRDSDLIIMEQQDQLGILPTHSKFVDYVNAHMDRLYYRPGDNTISYDADDAGVSMDNVWGVEDWGRWSKGKECAIHLYGGELAKSGGDLSIHMSANSYDVKRNADILFNGKSVGALELLPSREDYVVSVPADFVDLKENTIEFRLHGDTFSPKDRGESDDDRNLGIGIANLTIEGGDAR